LARNGGGSVVNILSIAALANVPLFISYSMSKAALHSFTQSTRLALRAQGTVVIGAYPGPVDTDMASSLPFDKTPPEGVAKAILDGVEAGNEEVFPDPMSLAMGTTFGASPKQLEREVAAMFAA
jgi:short-subunit dehydrogenase